ncbi:MAG TPA: hypothetical protein VIT65_27520 [Microlunatus sp.]
MTGSAADRSVRVVVASLLVTMVALTAGCGSSSSDTEDLTLSLRETRTAVRSVELALDLLDQGRTTRAAAQVTAGDMVDQIGLAQQRLADAPGDTEELRDLRRRCQVVVSDSLVAVQDTEDALSTTDGGAGVGADLPQVQSAVDATLTDVGER